MITGCGVSNVQGESERERIVQLPKETAQGINVYQYLVGEVKKMESDSDIQRENKRQQPQTKI